MSPIIPSLIQDHFAWLDMWYAMHAVQSVHSLGARSLGITSLLCVVYVCRSAIPIGLVDKRGARQSSTSWAALFDINCFDGRRSLVGMELHGTPVSYSCQ